MPKTAVAFTPKRGPHAGEEVQFVRHEPAKKSVKNIVRGMKDKAPEYRERTLGMVLVGAKPNGKREKDVLKAIEKVQKEIAKR